MLVLLLVLGAPGSEERVALFAGVFRKFRHRLARVIWLDIASQRSYPALILSPATGNAHLFLPGNFVAIPEVNLLPPPGHIV